MPLGPDEAKKCRECGKIVCRDHIRYHPTRGWLCIRCFQKYTEEKKPTLQLNIAYIDL